MQSALKKIQELLQLACHKLTQEVSTRWNSTFEMYKRIIEQQPAISAMLMKSTRKEARELILSPSAITQLEDLVTVLEPLAQATEYLATEKWPFLSVVQPLLAALCKRALKPKEGEPAIILQFKSAVLSSTQHHFGDERQQLISQLASVLDPRYKMPSSCRLPTGTLSAH